MIWILCLPFVISRVVYEVEHTIGCIEAMSKMNTNLTPAAVLRLESCKGRDWQEG